jgi:hypothetical protein
MSMYSDDEKNTHFTGAETLYSYGGCIWDDKQLPQYIGGYCGDSVASGDFPYDPSRGSRVFVHPVALQVARAIREQMDKSPVQAVSRSLTRYRIMDAGFLHGPLGVKRTWRDTAGVNHSAYRVLPGLFLRWSDNMFRWCTEEQSKGFEFASSGVDDPIKQWRERCLRSTSAIIMSDSATDNPLCMILLYDLRYRFVLNGDRDIWSVVRSDFNKGSRSTHTGGIVVQLVDLSTGGTWGGLVSSQLDNQCGDYLFPVPPSEAETQYSSKHKDRYTKVRHGRAGTHHLEQVQSYKESTRTKLLASYDGKGTTASWTFGALTRGNASRAFAYTKAKYNQDIGRDEPFIPDRKLPTNVRTQVRKLVKGLKHPVAIFYDVDGRERVAKELNSVRIEMCNRISKAVDRVGNKVVGRFQKTPRIAELQKFRTGWEDWSAGETLGGLVSLLVKGVAVHEYLDAVPEELLSVLAGEEQAYKEGWHHLKDNIKYVIREDLTSGYVWHSTVEDVSREAYTDVGVSKHSASKVPCRLYHSWDAWGKRFNNTSVHEQVATLQSFLVSSDNQPGVHWAAKYTRTDDNPVKYKQDWEGAVSAWKIVPNSTPYIKGLGWAYRSEPSPLEKILGRGRGSNIFVIEN